MTADDVRVLLKDACNKDGGIRAWARKHDLSAAYISDILLGRREPGPSVLRVFGLEAVHPETIYRKVKRA